MTAKEIQELATSVNHESTNIDFKSEVLWDKKSDVIELIKDIIAMANTGGGCILLGVKDNGIINDKYSSQDLIDHADLVNKIEKYTDTQFSDFAFQSINREDGNAISIIINESHLPIVFTNPGTYEIEDNRQKTAFNRGTIYFRHGAKSEPCNNYDIKRIFDSELLRVKDSWLGNIKKVVEAPIGHVAYMAPPNVTLVESKEAIPIRITDKEDAPVYKIQNPDDICPFRQKEVLKEVNNRLKDGFSINGYDITAVNAVFEINENKPDLFYKSLYGPKQYSKAYIDFLLQNFNKNDQFFSITRERYRILHKKIET